MKRIVSVALVLIMLISAIAGCGKSADAGNASVQTVPKTVMNIYAIKGPTGIGMAPLMEKAATGASKHDYRFTVASAPDEVVGKISSGEADIAAVPTNMASSLYKKTSGAVSVLALNTTGNLFILEAGNTVNSIADLRGKTVYSTGQGANPEFVLNYVLKKNGLEAGSDVTVNYLAQNDELAAKLASEPGAILLAPQPTVAAILAKNSAARIAVDMTAEFESAAQTKMYMGCIIVRKEFLLENEAAVMEFLEEYKASVETVMNNTDTAAQLSAKYEIIASEAIAKSAIPESGICYVDGEDMKQGLSAYLQICGDEMPKLIGGELPSDEFYCINR